MWACHCSATIFASSRQRGCARQAAGVSNRGATVANSAVCSRPSQGVFQRAVTPIGSVSRAFHAQIGAVQQRETSIQQARKVAVEQLAKVAGSVELSQRIDEAIRRLDAIRTVRACLPQIPKRDLGNVVPGNPPVEIIDPALGADYSAL